eukprot:scaffold99320_cov30-Prasinocladus_malaysianus.AAC.1
MSGESRFNIALVSAQAERQATRIQAAYRGHRTRRDSPPRNNNKRNVGTRDAKGQKRQNTEQVMSNALDNSSACRESANMRVFWTQQASAGDSASLDNSKSDALGRSGGLGSLRPVSQLVSCCKWHQSLHLTNH